MQRLSNNRKTVNTRSSPPLSRHPHNTVKIYRLTMLWGSRERGGGDQYTLTYTYIYVYFPGGKAS